MIIQRHDQDALFQDEGLVPDLVDSMSVNDVLTHVFRHVHATFMHELFDTKALYYPQLDAILQRLSEQAWGDTPGWSGSGLHMIVGSLFSAVGGHSRVAKNCTALGERSIVVITDPFNEQTIEQQREMLDFFAPVPVVFLPHGDLAFKLDYLCALIRQLRPDYTSCFNHHVDPIPVAATAAAPVPNRIYHHHCDYRPSLGASLNVFTHLDYTDELARLCSNRAGAGHVRLLSLHDTQIAETSRMPMYVPGKPLNTVSAGGAGKYLFAPEYSALSYPHVVPSLLAASGGVHHHYGNLSDDRLAFIRAVLARAAIDPERFVYHGNVKSVSASILQVENPVYVPSFPVGGAMMIVEVMSAGVPVMINTHALATDAYDFTSVAHRSLMPELHQAFGEAAQIGAALEAFASNYAAYSRSSKDCFEKRHSRGAFLSCLASLGV